MAPKKQPVVEKVDNVAVEGEGGREAPVDRKPRDPETLTKYERTKIIGIRAEQLARGAQPFVDIDPGEPFDACEVAERELNSRLLPFVVVRHLPDGKAVHLGMDDIKVGVP